LKVLEGTLPGESKQEGFRINGSGNQRGPTRNGPQTTDRKTESTDHVARRLKPAGLTEFTRNF